MELGSPVVSVIVPIYNIVSYIRECIDSIRMQTYRDIEIILIDDGSTDGSGMVCEEIASYDDRIRVIRQENRGVVFARGRGIDRANGRYMLFVDGDDWIEPDMIETLLNQIGDAELITTKVCREISPNNWIEECDQFPEGVYSGEDELIKIYEKMIYNFDNGYVQPFLPGICYRLFLSSLVKKIYKKMDINITYEEDAVFIYKYLLQCHSIVITHQSFYHYRYRKGSAMHSVNTKVLANINKVYLTLEEEFKKHKLKDCLMLQLQKWVTHLTCKSINDFMGFDKRVCIPEYIADLSYLEDKKIILYGAGKAGKDTYMQMYNYEYSIVIWVDKNYKFYQEIGMPVVSPDEILKVEYDLIYIAVGDVALAEKIRKNLLVWKISDEKIIWRKPMHVF